MLCIKNLIILISNTEQMGTYRTWTFPSRILIFVNCAIWTSGITIKSIYVTANHEITYEINHSESVQNLRKLLSVNLQVYLYAYNCSSSAWQSNIFSKSYWSAACFFLVWKNTNIWHADLQIYFLIVAFIYHKQAS